jgi:hypothetical protein
MLLVFALGVGLAIGRRLTCPDTRQPMYLWDLIERIARRPRGLELGWAVQEARRDGGDRAADVILKLAGEVRQQLGLQLSISRTLGDLRIVKEFHDTVVEAIREESPETARRIVARLKRSAAPPPEYRPAHPHWRSRWRCGVTRSTS